MRRLLIKSFLAVSTLALSGCVASMAANAVGAVVSSARGAPQSNEQLRPAAAKACNERASAFGTVHIIDVEQHSRLKIIIWGTADNGKVRRGFECAYGTKITEFKLRSLAKAG